MNDEVGRQMLLVSRGRRHGVDPAAPIRSASPFLLLAASILLAVSCNVATVTPTGDGSVDDVQGDGETQADPGSDPDGLADSPDREAGEVCSMGETDSRDCDRCGQQTRSCVDGEWGPWTDCSSRGECAPGDRQEEGCPTGVRTRHCFHDCVWGEWSDCATCAPLAMQEEDCGQCGTRSRICDSDGSWGAWSTCLETGVCEPFAEETEPCGDCGVSTRTCEPNCYWGDWSECREGGTCEPGTVDNTGGKPRVCTDECIWQHCYEWCRNQGRRDPEDCDDTEFLVPSGGIVYLVCRNNLGGIAYVARNTGPLGECQNWEDDGEDPRAQLDYVSTLQCDRTGAALEIELPNDIGSTFWVGVHLDETGGGAATEVCVACPEDWGCDPD